MDRIDVASTDDSIGHDVRLSNGFLISKYSDVNNN